ncbi:MAG: hypothetical protein QW404_00035 [Candidatus Nanoarchaeia archaeon]
MKQDLVIRLNTKASMAIAENPDMVGLYSRVHAEEAEKYRKGTFGKIINYCIEQGIESTLEEDRVLAGEIRTMLGENGPDKPFEIMVYGENKIPKRNVISGGSIMHLEDKVESYIENRSRDNGESYDYLDMVVDLNTKVGR